MDFCGKIITAPLIYLNNSFRKNIQINIDENGQIKEIGENLTKWENVLNLENLVKIF